MQNIEKEISKLKFPLRLSDYKISKITTLNYVSCILLLIIKNSICKLLNMGIIKNNLMRKLNERIKPPKQIKLRH